MEIKQELVHDGSVDKLPVEIAELLECGVCYVGQRLDRIYVTSCCSKSLCEGCKKHVASKCPFCKGLLLYITRNRFAENILGFYTRNVTVISHSRAPNTELPGEVQVCSDVSTDEIGLFHYLNLIESKLSHPGILVNNGRSIRNGNKFIEYYKPVDDAINLSLRQLSTVELVNIGIALCEAVLYLHSKNYYGSGVRWEVLHISRNFEQIKFAPRLRELPRNSLVLREKEIKRGTREDIEHIIGTLEQIGCNEDITADSILELRSKIFDLLDLTSLSLCERLIRDYDYFGHNFAKYQPPEFVYTKQQVLQECTECKIWELLELWHHRCTICGRVPVGSPVTLFITNFGRINFDKYRRISELSQIIAKYLLCNVAAIRLYDEDRKLIDGDITIFQYLMESSEKITLHINRRLA